MQLLFGIPEDMEDKGLKELILFVAPANSLRILITVTEGLSTVLHLYYESVKND